MPIIITLAHQKGGVGKTTLAANLYRHFADQVDCAILDTDPQGSIAESYNLIGDDPEAAWKDMAIIDNEPFQNGIPYEVLRERDERVIIIDTPPYLAEHLHNIIALSDLVVIPSRVGQFDGLAMRRTLGLINEIRQGAELPKVAVVLNDIKKSTKTWNKEFKESVALPDVYVCKTEVVNRVDYSRELSVAPYVGEEINPVAYAEINRLGEELSEYLTQ